MADQKSRVEEDLNLLQDLLARAKAKGADGADAMMYESVSLGTSIRLGKREDLERSESRDMGLRVFIGRQQASVSGNDFSSRSMEEMAERAVAMARAAPDDPYCGLAERELLSQESHELDLFDDREPTAEELYDAAEAAEAAALEIDGITNSEGGGAGWGMARIALATSDGFAGGYASTSHSLYASVLAGEGTAMERDYESSSAHHHEDLMDAQSIGQVAATRAVARLNPRKLSTGRMPVVFAPRVARSILGHFVSAISGTAVARGTSFLKDRMGEQVFAPGITITDDPHRLRGLSSKPFDGEGVRNSQRNLIEDGYLTTWLLHTASAKQLGLQSTGHASRGISGPPAPSATNLHMEAGSISPEAMIADIKDGLYVTELIGFGINGVTGDYSRGAVGFRIENGDITHPVSELTIAGNLKDMFKACQPADDLEFRYGTNAPTLRIDGLMVAGA